MADIQLYTEINTLPLHLKREVADFVEFLKQKAKSKNKIRKRKFGYAKGFFKMSEDFDEPLDEFKEYME